MKIKSERLSTSVVRSDQVAKEPQYMNQKVFSSPKTFYVRDANRRPVATVCYLSSCDQPGELCVGVSVCNKRGSFKKSLGRTVAEGRAVSMYINREHEKPYACVMTDFAKNTHERHMMILDFLVCHAKSLNLPSHFVSAAQNRIDAMTIFAESMRWVNEIKASACCGC